MDGRTNNTSKTKEYKSGSLLSVMSLATHKEDQYDLK
jgi:hypothetical protein